MTYVPCPYRPEWEGNRGPGRDNWPKVSTATAEACVRPQPMPLPLALFLEGRMDSCVLTGHRGLNDGWYPVSLQVLEKY